MGAGSLNKRMNSLLFSFFHHFYYFPFHRKIKDLGRCIDGSITFSFPILRSDESYTLTIIIEMDGSYINVSRKKRWKEEGEFSERIREASGHRYRHRSKTGGGNAFSFPLRRIDLLYPGSKGRTSRRIDSFPKPDSSTRSHSDPCDPISGSSSGPLTTGTGPCHGPI